MVILADTRTGPLTQTDGAGDQSLRQSRMGSLVVTNAHGTYFEAASRRNIFRAHATISGILAYNLTTIGGPVIWNSGPNNVVIIGLGYALTSAAFSSGAIGLTGAGGQYSAPSASGPTVSSGNCYIGGQLPSANAYATATVVNTGTFLLPFGQIHSGALTVDTSQANWVEFGGMVVVPPGTWISPAASTTIPNVILQIGVVWEEVPTGY